MMRVAILGAGHIAESMAVALKGLEPEGVVRYAVASRSLEKAQSFADKWGFGKAYGSYEELAEDEQVDLIYIATPHSHHYEQAMLCVEHGRNCLVEKAFCANSGQAKRVLAFAKEKKVLVAEAMWTRYQPSAKVIADTLASGVIGTLRSVESDFSIPIKGVKRLVDPALAGGALLDLGIYSITVPAMYLAGEAQRVSVTCDKTEQGVDATDEITMTYENGVTAVCRCSFIEENPSNYAKFVGDRGSLIFSSINSPKWMEVYDIEGKLLERKEFPDDINGYEYEVRACKEALEKGLLETPAMPHSEIIRVMEQMDRIRCQTGVIFPFEDELNCP